MIYQKILTIPGSIPNVHNGSEILKFIDSKLFTLLAWVQGFLHCRNLSKLCGKREKSKEAMLGL